MKKKPLRLVPLALVLGIVSWMSMRSDAGAYPYPLCPNVQGTYCTTIGSWGYCWVQQTGTAAKCTCTSGHQWYCNYSIPTS